MSGTVFLLLRLALTISLYMFLGVAFYILWRDLKYQSTLLATRKPPSLSLLQQSEDELTTFHFSTPEITIGRDPACDCVLDDYTVSAQHARLSYRQGQWWLEDLRSTNGTFLNQEAVSMPLVITIGDELRFGQVVLSISTDDNNFHDTKSST